MRDVEEIKKIIYELRTRNLKFINIDGLTDAEAIKLIQELDDSYYSALKTSALPKKNRGTIPHSIKFEAFPIGSRRADNSIDPRLYSILNEDFDGELSEQELSIRNEYLKELIQLKSNTHGCSSCQLGALKRKYIGKLISANKTQV